MQLVYSTAPANRTFYILEHSLGIYDFRTYWPCLIVKIRVTRSKFLRPTGYCTVFNCAFNFCTTNVFWGDVESDYAPTTMKLRTTATTGAPHSFNCFGHVIYTQQNSYQIPQSEICKIYTWNAFILGKQEKGMWCFIFFVWHVNTWGLFHAKTILIE